MLFCCPSPYLDRRFRVRELWRIESDYFPLKSLTFADFMVLSRGLQSTPLSGRYSLTCWRVSALIYLGVTFNVYDIFHRISRRRVSIPRLLVREHQYWQRHSRGDIFILWLFRVLADWQIETSMGSSVMTIVSRLNDVTVVHYHLWIHPFCCPWSLFGTLMYCVSTSRALELGGQNQEPPFPCLNAPNALLHEKEATCWTCHENERICVKEYKLFIFNMFPRSIRFTLVSVCFSRVSDISRIWIETPIQRVVVHASMLKRSFLGRVWCLTLISAVSDSEVSPSPVVLSNMPIRLRLHHTMSITLTVQPNRLDIRWVFRSDVHLQAPFHRSWATSQTSRIWVSTRINCAVSAMKEKRDNKSWKPTISTRAFSGERCNWS